MARGNKRRRRREWLVVGVVVVLLASALVARHVYLRYPRREAPAVPGIAAAAAVDAALSRIAVLREGTTIATAVHVGDVGDRSYFLTKDSPASGPWTVADGPTASPHNATRVASDSVLGVALFETEKWREGNVTPLVSTRAAIGSVVFTASFANVARADAPQALVTSSRVRGPLADLPDPEADADRPWIALESFVAGQDAGGLVFTTGGAAIGVTVAPGRYVAGDALVRFARRSGRFTIATASRPAEPDPDHVAPPAPTLATVGGAPAFVLHGGLASSAVLVPGVSKLLPNAELRIDNISYPVTKTHVVPQGVVAVAQVILKTPSNNRQAFKPGRFATITAPDGTSSALAIAAVSGREVWLDAFSGPPAERGIVHTEGEIVGVVVAPASGGLQAVVPVSAFEEVVIPHIRSHIVDVFCTQGHCNVWDAFVLEDIMGVVQHVRLVVTDDHASPADVRPDTDSKDPVLAFVPASDRPTVVSGRLPMRTGAITVGLQLEADGALFRFAPPPVDLVLNSGLAKRVVATPADTPVLQSALSGHKSEVDLCYWNTSACEAGCLAGRTADCVRLAHHIKASSPERAAQLWERACRLLDDEGCASRGEALWHGTGVVQDRQGATDAWYAGCFFSGPQSCLVAAGWLNDADESASPFIEKACARGNAPSCRDQVLTPEGLQRRWDNVVNGREPR